mgnify:FL=1
MRISTQQITGRGVAQQSGLDTLSSIINYTGEYINFGDAFSYGTKLSSDSDFATTSVTPHITSLDKRIPFVINQWYRYYSSGSLYTQPSSASSSNGFFTLNSITTGGLPSYCGMYQKLLLTTGKEYKASIQTTFDAGIGTLYINTYTPSDGSYILTSTTSKVLPNTSGTLGLAESTFTAQSGNDIILIYATTTETSSQDLLITNISIEEKQEYLTPVYATDMWGNAHKVLRVAADQTISDD